MILSLKGKWTLSCIIHDDDDNDFMIMWLKKMTWWLLWCHDDNEDDEDYVDGNVEDEGNDLMIMIS